MGERETIMTVSAAVARLSSILPMDSFASDSLSPGHTLGAACATAPDEVQDVDTSQLALIDLIIARSSIDFWICPSSPASPSRPSIYTHDYSPFSSANDDNKGDTGDGASVSANDVGIRHRHARTVEETDPVSLEDGKGMATRGATAARTEREELEHRVRHTDSGVSLRVYVQPEQLVILSVFASIGKSIHASIKRNEQRRGTNRRRKLHKRVDEGMSVERLYKLPSYIDARCDSVQIIIAPPCPDSRHPQPPRGQRSQEGAALPLPSRHLTLLSLKGRHLRLSHSISTPCAAHVSSAGLFSYASCAVAAFSSPPQHTLAPNHADNGRKARGTYTFTHSQAPRYNARRFVVFPLARAGRLQAGIHTHHRTQSLVEMASHCGLDGNNEHVRSNFNNEQAEKKEEENVSGNRVYIRAEGVTSRLYLTDKEWLDS